METVYIETTVVSYLAAYSSRDLIVTAHQQITQEWWDVSQGRFNIFISEAVLEEISAGDENAATRRMEIVKELPILELTQDVRHLVHIYKKNLNFPEKASADLVHIAFAVAFEMDYLLTWNCSHIANGEVIRRLYKLNKEIKRATPLILTPEELLEPL